MPTPRHLLEELRKIDVDPSDPFTTKVEVLSRAGKFIGRSGQKLVESGVSHHC
jgi:hypothetical protein